MDTFNTFPAPVAADIIEPAHQFKTISNGMRQTVGSFAHPVTNGDEALQAAGLDWEVEYRSLADIAGGALDHSQNAAKIGHIMRTDIDEPLGSSVRAGYSVQQNSVLGDLGEQVIGMFGGQFTNALFKGFGDTVALTVKLPQSVDLGNGRELVQNMTIIKGHGGTGSIKVIGHAIDFFCTNQIASMMRNGKHMLTIQHTASADGKIRLARHELAPLLTAEDEFHQSLANLLREPATLREYMPTLMPRPERRADQTHAQYNNTLRAWERKTGVVSREYNRDFNDNLKGTKLGVLWAFQGYEQHYTASGTARSHDTQAGRFLAQTQPLANRAYAVLTA
ncbi:MAG: DUF932 domain-containing protein [Rhodobacterales bacterium]|nr:DUF932 domain-containing protein [Rhodobacterales bacterium]